MELIELKCPNCGAKLEIKFSWQRFITCDYCWSTFYLGVDKGELIEEELVSV